MYDVSYEDEEAGPNYNNNRELGDRERLIRDRQRLLDEGSYTHNDELIKEFDRRIAMIS